MQAIETDKLRNFLGLDEADGTCRLYLPIFDGPSSLNSGICRGSNLRATPRKRGFEYLGHTFADRDARSASYVTSILSCVIGLDNIQWQSVADFNPGKSGTVFLFGSRSNKAAKWATRHSALGKFLRFKFASKWSIQCSGDKVFSLPAPNRLTRNEYENTTDYGVIGRFQETDKGAQTFLIAGLGSRATEGCGYFLANHWKNLARSFGRRDFAIVLKFAPPVDPKTSEVAVAFDDEHTEGFSPSL